MTKRRQTTKARPRRKPHRQVPINEHVTQSAPDEVLRAMGRLPPDLDWAVMRPNVLPILPRRRPLPPELGQPVTMMLPPGVPTGFGVDIGPAVLHIGPDLLASWEIELAEVASAALENLGRRTATMTSHDLLEQRVEGVRVVALQSGSGLASTLVLLPDELVRIFGAAPQCFVAPMRDLLLSVDLDTEPAFVVWLREEFARVDPNAVAVDAFKLENGRLTYSVLERLVPLV